MNKFNKSLYLSKEMYFKVSTVILFVYLISFQIIIFKKKIINSDMYKSRFGTLIFPTGSTMLNSLLLLIDITFNITLLYKNSILRLYSFGRFSVFSCLLCIIPNFMHYLSSNKSKTIEKYRQLLSNKQYHSINTMTDTDITSLIKKITFSNIGFFFITIAIIAIYFYSNDKFIKKHIEDLNKKYEVAENTKTSNKKHEVEIGINTTISCNN